MKNIWILFTLILLFVSCNEDKIRKERTKYYSILGQKIVLNKDTLIIIDIEVWSDRCVLSNGLVVDRTVAEKYKILDK